MSWLDLLRVWDCKEIKKRFGDPNDGGYTMVLSDNYDQFLSAGVGANTSFESDVLDYYNDLECNIFDYSAIWLPHPHKNLKLIKKYISSVNSENATNLKNEIAGHENILLKMDIEGGEWEFLSSCTSQELSVFKQIVIELHGLGTNEWSATIGEKIKDLSLLLTTHTLVHLHGNNYARMVEVEGIMIPTVAECVFLRKNNEEVYNINSKPNPAPGLDQPNCQHIPDLNLNHWPFRIPKDCILTNIGESTNQILQYEGAIPLDTSNHELCNNPLIPRLLHIVWLGVDDSPDWFWKNLRTWRKLLNRKWQIRVWTMGDLCGNEFSEDVLNKVEKAHVPAQKTDILRCAILEKYGGFYFDADFIPLNDLENLLCKFWWADAIGCNERTFDWPYLTNAFMACVPHHRWVQLALSYTLEAELNTRDIHLKTGPICTGRAAVQKGVNILLLPTRWFYRVKGVEPDPKTMFASHQWAASWLENFDRYCT